jgi:putative heme degradation protein
VTPILISCAVVGAFVAGVVFHKLVVSEAQAIKAHVTAELEKLRSDVSSLLSKAAAKV